MDADICQVLQHAQDFYDRCPTGQYDDEAALALKTLQKLLQGADATDTLNQFRIDFEKIQ